MFSSRRRVRAEWVRVPEPRSIWQSLGERFPGVERVLDLPRNLFQFQLPAEPSPEAPARPMTMVQALQEIGLPRLPGLTPAAELLEFLKDAAEIEHGLMVQYLYAMYSAVNLASKGIIRNIAIEEMGHLITVQNLLLACGGRPHFDRYDWTGGSEYQPFPFRLEPLSLQSIAKYAACEMPEAVPAEDQDIIGEMEKNARASAGGMDPIRIGLLYMKIYWLLRADDNVLANPALEPWPDYPVARIAGDPELAHQHVPDSVFTDTAARQADPFHWRRNFNNVIVRKIAGRSDALNAVASITEQGEGFGGTPNGHFERFVKIYRATRASPNAARPVPTDPWYRSPDSAGRDPANKITSTDGVNFAELGDRLYEAILLAAWLYLQLPDSLPPSERARAANLALRCMTDGLGVVGTTLVDIERRNGDPNPDKGVCSLPFYKPPDFDPGSDAAALRARVKAVILEGVTLAQNIVDNSGIQARKDAAGSVRDALNDVVSLLDGLAV